METLGSIGGSAPAKRIGFATAFDAAGIVQKIACVKDAAALPRGTVVGDRHGGLTFTDAVAAALESRSHGGWQEVETPAGETWTVIVLNK
jgi:crotonobetainyl-CoA:carnitine CoA-transferase CaiB-like acyl-CoA transferase